MTARELLCIQQRPDDRAAQVPAAAQRVRPAGGRVHGRRHQAVLPQLQDGGVRPTAVHAERHPLLTCYRFKSIYVFPNRIAIRAFVD